MKTSKQRRSVRDAFFFSEKGVTEMKPELQTENLDLEVPIANVDEINELLRRYGVKFGIYKNGVFKEQLFPFDPIPRIITAQEFAAIEKGLIQRVDALNMFIYDIYHDKKIIADNIVPEDFVYISSGYLDHISHSSKALCLSLLSLVDIIFGFWGCLGENVYDEEIKTIIECGKYVERLDLDLRLKCPFAMIEREFGRLCTNLRKVPKNTPYRYNTNQLCTLVEVMGMGESYTESKEEAISALGRLFEPVKRTVLAG